MYVECVQVWAAVRRAPDDERRTKLQKQYIYIYHLDTPLINEGSVYQVKWSRLRYGSASKRWSPGLLSGLEDWRARLCSRGI